jgi:hypothetical protein
MRKKLIIPIILLLITNNALSNDIYKNNYKIIDISTLNPKYNEKITDYSIRNCDKKETKITISDKEIVRYKNKILKNNITINTKKDDIIELVINNKKIFIRCLPNDFPNINFRNYDINKKKNVLYSFATANRVDINNWMVEKGYYIIADENGTPLWYMKAAGSAMIMKILDNESIYTVGLPPGMTPSYAARSGAAIIKTDFKGKIIKKILPKDKKYVIDTHGFEKLKNNNYLIISTKIIKNYDLSSYTKNLTPYNLGGGGTKQCDVTNTKKATVAMPFIMEINDKGEIINQIRFDEIISPSESQLFALSDIDYTGKKPNCVVNIYHPVNLSTNESEDNYILTNRFTSATYIIDKVNKKIIAKIGGTKNENSFEIINDPYGDRGPIGHHGGYISENKLILLDNRRLPQEEVRAVVYELNFDQKKAIHLFSRKQPERSCELFENKIICITYSMGTALFLNDKSILASWGFRPNSPNMATHFDKDGNILVDLRNNEKNQTTYQINYFEKTLVNAKLLRDTASSKRTIPLPFENKLGWSLSLKDNAITGPGN